MEIATVFYSGRIGYEIGFGCVVRIIKNVKQIEPINDRLGFTKI